MRRFGTGSGTGSIEKVIEQAKAAEAYGFDYFFIPDESPSPPWRDVCVSLTAAALNTRKIKLASGIFVPYTRHPALLAVFMASLAEVAGDGRVILGLGPGGTMTLRPLGIKMWERPVAMLRETVEVVNRLLAGETVDYDGKMVKVSKLKISPIPKTRVPIYIAARSPLMLNLIGEVADGAELTSPLSYVEDALNYIKKGAEKAGRDFKDLEICNLVSTVISDDEKKAKDRLRSGGLTHIIADTPDYIHEKAGVDLERVEAIRSALREVKPEKATSLVTDEIVDVFAIAGNKKYCTKRIEEFFDAGVTQMNLGLGSIEEMKIAGKEIIPKLREK